MTSDIRSIEGQNNAELMIWDVCITGGFDD